MTPEEPGELELSVDEPKPPAAQDRLPIDPPRAEFGSPLDKPRFRGPRPAPVGPVDEERVGDYRHDDASRTNIPEAGLATQDTVPVEPRKYEYDPHLDPQLVWAGKAEHTSFEVAPDAFEMLRGTTSLPFSLGEQGRAAIKVIDFRGNEAIKILDLPDA